MSDNETHVIKIHGLSFYEGHGVGKSDDGKVYFVDQACPGDVVEIEVYKSKKNFAFARISKIIEPSPHRVKPLCNHFEDCGGCSIQHTMYSVQVEEKQKVLKRYQEKSSKSFKLLPFQPSSSPYHYRSRIEVHVKNNKWGFYKKKSKSLVHPDQCVIVHPDINTNLNRSNLSDGDYHVDLKEIKLRSRGIEGIFQQINPEINLALKDYILEVVESAPFEIKHLYDLYAGSGNYSLHLSDRLSKPSSAIQYYCVELSRNLVETGKNNSLNKPNIFWVQKSVEDFLLTKDLKTTDSMLLINPPRDGVDKSVIDAISKSRIKYLIYVSCNPMTLFRDIDALGPSASILSLKGFDMFPQTMHFETVAFLSL